MSNSNPPAPAPRWLVRLGLLALAGYAVLIAFYFSNVAAGSDSSGYLNSARLFAAGEFHTTLRVPSEFGAPEKQNPMQFLPLGFWPVLETTRINPTYPTGLPLHLALAGKVLGWTAGPIVVGLFTALGAVGLVYATARELGLGANLAAAGAAVLALCPMFIWSAVQVLSDALATTWCLVAVYVALRARRHRGWAAVTGVAFAVAVLVRPTNLVLAPALLVLLGFDWKKLSLFALGGLPGALWLGLYNDHLYGGPLRSGYGSIGDAFAVSWFAPTAWHFLKWLAALLPTVLLGLPLVAVARRESRTRELLALALWFAAIVGVYVFYEVSHETWWCLRFILPAMPALILAGLLGIETLAQAKGAAFRVRAALTLTVWAAAGALFWSQHFFILRTKNGELTYAEAAAVVREKVPANALVATMTFSGALYYYTDLPVLRWDQVDAAQFDRYSSLAQKAGRQIYAVEFKWEEDRLHEHCPGAWELVASVRDARIWQLRPPAAPDKKS